MKVFVHSLGCRVNQYEAQLLQEKLADLPYAGELHVVNTCTVTSLADRKARQRVRRLKREHPQALVVAVGCGADGAGARLRAAGADLVVGNRDKARLRSWIEAFLQGRPPPDGGWIPMDEERVVGPAERARALLKVQDGCTVGCAFCRTWQVRGPLRSKTPAVARDEAAALARAGHREIVIVGINLAQYGQDLPNRPSLVDLLRELLQVDGVRFRLSSLNPEGVSGELVALFAREPRLCPYLHLPLQSGDDRALQRMGRAYTAAEYRERAQTFLAAVPRATLGADVMVGFPGEDDAAFRRTAELLADLEPLNVHIFRFSPRPGTPAAGLRPPVPAEVAAQRAAELADLAAGWSRAARRRFLGEVLQVLVEEEDRGLLWGHAENYLWVGVRGARTAPRGTMVATRLVQVDEGHMLGVMIDR
ncbi:MAG: MiaB/RimO family radical SAM methylthiotransferase [Candidatus Acetothermia bacterium]|jgi:threonylcarbamoyladenosine tRNA methylthiotransferase MtaB|nr:MiaB/RimO family radical SAM methylthiotransferase [Candidatus Acetothermia bacterium]